MQSINVEEIMKEIRADIAAKGYADEEISFGEALANMDSASLENRYNELEFNSKYDYISSHYNNPVYFELKGNPVKVFFQKAVRRVLLFVIFPAFQFQNYFNEGTYSCIRQMKNYINETTDVRRLPKKVAAMEKKMAEQEALILQLQEELKELKKG